MVIRKLCTNDTKQFRDLIIDMYSNLKNLEFFSPMPYDFDNVKSILENPRFYIIGVFDGEFLCAVSSFDYKCGKLLTKINFSKECNTEKLVEIGFTMVHSKYRDKGIMKQMVNYLAELAKQQGFEWIFGKVHIDNLASSKSFIYNDFKPSIRYKKEVNKDEFLSLSLQPFINKEAKGNSKITLKNNSGNEKIIVDYEILLKKL